MKGSATAFEAQVLRTIRKFRMLSDGDHVLVAVSGGLDSTALLACLHNLARGLQLTLTVAHLNHGLRGVEADEDEEFVRRLCADLGLTLIAGRAKLGGRGVLLPNLEEAARSARYDFLQSVADRAGAVRIAVGHTLDDQAETFLLRMVRGSGPLGLSAIHPVKGKRIIRPLIECARETVALYLADVGLTHREDSSNRSLERRRNRVRHELIPYLREHFNPGVNAALARAAGFCREAAEYMEAQAEEAARSLTVCQGENLALDAAAVLRLHPAIRRIAVRRALARWRGSLRGFTHRHVAAIIRLCRPGMSGKGIALPGGAAALRRLELLLLVKSPPRAPRDYRYELPIPGGCEIPEAGMCICAAVEENRPADTKLLEARLNPGLLPGPLVIRSRLPGDRYGGAGRRKVKKMLLAARIPLEKRALLPMVTHGDVVVWIPGFRPAKSFIAPPDAGRCVLLRAEALGGNSLQAEGEPEP